VSASGAKRDELRHDVVSASLAQGQDEARVALFFLFSSPYVKIM